MNFLMIQILHLMKKFIQRNYLRFISFALEQVQVKTCVLKFYFIFDGLIFQQCLKIQLLLEKFAEDDSQRRSFLQSNTKSGFTPLHVAIYKGHSVVVEELLKSGSDPNLFLQSIPPPLHLAAMCGNADIIKILFKYGADLHTLDFAQFSALHCATYFGNELAVKALINCGADPNFSGAVHDRPLHIAASKTHVSIVSILLEAGGDRKSIFVLFIIYCHYFKLV